MAMDGKLLGDAIAELIVSPDAPAEMKAAIKSQWEAIGATIVAHIQTNGVVVVDGKPGVIT